MSSDQPRTRHRASRYAMDDAAYAPSSASSSDNSDRGTQSHYSSSRRVLAHVLARKERDSKQMHQLLKLTFAKLDEESQRATDAERRAAECLVRARAAIDARAQADADAASARTELAMYKLQLDQAQREIFRAQEMLTGLEARRHDAEEDAARSRSVARKLQEERAIEAAKEEGKQQGWHEGLRRGMLLGRQEAEEELVRSRRREEDLRSRSRRPRADDPLFSRVVLDHLEESSPERVTPRPPSARARNGRRTPDISPQTPAPPGPNRVPPFGHRGSHPELARSIRRRQYNEDTPQQRSRSRPRLETPTLPPAVPEPAHSRPYTPHEDSTPSIIQPIPVPASASSSSHPLTLRASPSPSPSPSHVHHAPVQIPPDNWIPRAQDASGDGRLSIYLPPPHELVEPLHVPDGPYAIAATPEEGSPAVVPPPPPLDFSPSTHVYAPTPPPPDIGPSASQTPRRGRALRPREREYTYGPPPPRPDLDPTASNPPPQPQFRDYASAPPPPDLRPASAPKRIAKVASNHSRASTHLSEFDILAPVDQSRSFGAPPIETEQGESEGELEYVDAPTVPIPRQPIAPNPPLQRRRATYDRRPSRGPPPPRQIILPAPLSQAQPVAAPPPPPLVPQPYVYTPQPQQSQQVQDSNDDMGFENDNEHNEDAPLLAVPPSERDRPHRSRTQSSGVIGISVEPPSPGNSPPSSGNNTALQRRADLLSPEHAERPLPLAMPVQIPYIDIFSGSRNKPQPPPPQQRSHRHAREEQERPLTPLPELELAGLVPPGMTVTNPSSSPGASATDLHHSAPHSHAYRHTRSGGGGGGGMRYEYEAAPVPAGMEYPASPLGARPSGAPPRRRGTAPTKTKEGGEAPLSPLAVASGLLGLKGRLGMPWRRNTAK
ncbi:hypothetical protein EDB89DRAFT_632980 [Lactarius sanguifluus]|nr:hypothetical protein EDB89DRAFT_632980 [Lactarius sanguifluus]